MSGWMMDEEGNLLSSKPRKGVELRDYRIERRRYLTQNPNDKGYVDWVVADLFEHGTRTCAVRIADAVIDREFDVPPFLDGSAEKFFQPQVIWPPHLVEEGVER